MAQDALETSGGSQTKPDPSASILGPFTALTRDGGPDDRPAPPPVRPTGPSTGPRPGPHTGPTGPHANTGRRKSLTPSVPCYWPVG
jgi:hypothetical protein